MTALVIDASSAVLHLRADPGGAGASFPFLRTGHRPVDFRLRGCQRPLRMGGRSLISTDTADRMIRALVDQPASRVLTHGPLLLAAVALTDRLTLANAVYLALARDRGADLLTIDRGLADVGESVGIRVISG